MKQSRNVVILKRKAPENKIYLTIIHLGSKDINGKEVGVGETTLRTLITS